MSEENVEVVLTATEAYNAGDLDVAFGFWATDVQVYPDAAFPESSPLLGLDAARAWFIEAGEAWINARNRTIEARALDADRVMHRGEWGGVGVASGVETYSPVTTVYTFRDGLVCRVEYYFDHSRALERLGLEE